MFMPFFFLSLSVSLYCTVTGVVSLNMLKKFLTTFPKDEDPNNMLSARRNCSLGLLESDCSTEKD
jgi:hypothetical protein